MAGTNAYAQEQSKKLDVKADAGKQAVNASSKDQGKAQDSRSYLPMKLGDKNKREIFELQAMLMQDGDYAKKVSHKTFLNGRFDENTEVAVKSFQSKHSLEPTGTVDAETWDAMKGSINLDENSAKLAKAGNSYDSATDKMLDYGSFYEGYTEKNNASNLTDATAGAGTDNFTRFGRDYSIATKSANFTNQYWCNMYCDAVMMESFGEDNARKMMGGMSALCSATAKNMGNLQSNKDSTEKKKTYKSYDYKTINKVSVKQTTYSTAEVFVEPKVGDFVFFNHSGQDRINHVGIVKSVSGKKIVTLEGNTTAGNSRNGTVVKEKTYEDYTNAKNHIVGFGRPDWSVVSKEFVEPQAKSEAQQVVQAQEQIKQTEQQAEPATVPTDVKAKADMSAATAQKGAEKGAEASDEADVWQTATLTAKEIEKAITFNNNTDNIGTTMRPYLRKLVGRPESKDKFVKADIQAIANWQLNNGLGADGQFGGQSMNKMAYIDYSNYIKANGGDPAMATGEDNKDAALENILQKVDARYDTIDKIAKMADLPPAIVAAVWSREASFKDGVYLHNGDPLGAKTTHVPVGIYFGKDQFVEAAVDALTRNRSKTIKTLNLNYTCNDLAAMCAFTEGYNGWGYRKYHTSDPTAYVTAGTTMYHGGKYVADGKYDSTVKDKQVGTMPIMSEILKRHPITGAATPVTVAKEAPKAAEEKTDGKIDTGAPEQTADKNPHGIDIEGAIKYNTKRNPGLVEELQDYVGAEKTGSYDEQTVLKIADWQAATKVLTADGKVGDLSFDYAIEHGLNLPGTLLPEVVISGKKENSNSNNQSNSQSNSNSGTNNNAGGNGGGASDAAPAPTVTGDWKQDILDAGVPNNMVYEGSDTLDTKKSGNKSMVYTLQALLNRALAGQIASTARADKKVISQTLGLDGGVGLNTLTHVMYYQFSRGYWSSSVNNVGVVTSTMWKDLRNNKSATISLNDTAAYESGKSLGKIDVDTFYDDKNGKAAIIKSGGADYYRKMSEAAKKAGKAPNGIGIESSYRSMTTQATYAKGCENSGQIELYALYIYGNGNTAALPGSSPHQHGAALDLQDCGGKKGPATDLYKWLYNNNNAVNNYKFKNWEQELWHWNYKG